MGDALPWLLLGPIAPLVTGGGKNNDKASNAENDAAAKQKELEGSLKDQQAKEGQANQNAIRDQAAQKQKQAAASARGRNSTILTSPLGLPSNQNDEPKTLLG